MRRLVFFALLALPAFFARPGTADQVKSTEFGRTVYQVVMLERHYWSEVRTGVLTTVDSSRGLTLIQTHSQLITGLLRLNGLRLQPLVWLQGTSVRKPDSVLFVFGYAGKQYQSLNKTWEPITFAVGGRSHTARSLGWFGTPEGGTVIAALPLDVAIDVLTKQCTGTIGKERFTLNPTMSESMFGQLTKSDASRIFQSFGSYLQELAGNAPPKLDPLASVRGQKVSTEPMRLGEEISARYDKFKDQTTVLLLGQELLTELPSGHLQLGVAFFCTGDSIVRPSEVFLNFVYEGKEWRFLKETERSLVFLLGKERLPLPITAHDGKIGESAYGVVRETMLVSVAPDVAVKILKANAEGRVGFTDFKFMERGRFAYRDFASLLESLGTSGAAATSR